MNSDPCLTYTYGYKIVGNHMKISQHVTNHVTIIHVMWQCLLRVFDSQSNCISHVTCSFDSSIIWNTFLTVQEPPDWFHFLSWCYSNDIWKVTRLHMIMSGIFICNLVTIGHLGSLQPDIVDRSLSAQTRIFYWNHLFLGYKFSFLFESFLI